MILGAARAGLLLCSACEMLNRPVPGADIRCARCGGGLHWRKPGSLARAWAFLTAACILYIPANLMPVMESGSLFGSSSDTIMSGVRYLWNSGDWLIAAVIFLASIVFPGAKLVALAVLLSTAENRSKWRARQRARVYRMLDVVGRWSMTDIFVTAIVVALVQFKTIGVINPGPGATAFAAVVVLTLFASMSFDPRLIWDAVEDGDE
jgi:paraquat-inducible protein A